MKRRRQETNASLKWLLLPPPPPSSSGQYKLIMNQSHQYPTLYLHRYLRYLSWTTVNLNMISHGALSLTTRYVFQKKNKHPPPHKLGGERHYVNNNHVWAAYRYIRIIPFAKFLSDLCYSFFFFSFYFILFYFILFYFILFYFILRGKGRVRYYKSKKSKKSNNQTIKNICILS